MRGRPPESNSKVGHVTWEEEFSCFVGSCGYYWHGHKFGGWQNEPPDPKRKRPASSGGGVSGSGNVDRVCRGRRPNGNERIGVIITYNIEHDCYQTEKEYYWHGTYNGGWKKNAPGVDSDVESEAENEEEEKKEDDPNVDVVVVDRPSKKKRKGNTKGRPPRKQIAEETIEYDAYKLCWTTTREGGLYWHGTYKGGWKDYPPKTTY